MYRGWMKNPVFEKEPYTEREAWEWMIASAAWRPTKQKVGAKIILLQKGQLSFSVRFMAESWGWTKSRVHRFLGRLKSETMIGTDGGTVQDIITIVNYSIYQYEDQKSGTVSGTVSGTDMGQMRDKEERHIDLKKEENNGHLDFGLEPSPAPKPESEILFERFWPIYPRKEKRKEAYTSFIRALRRAPFERILHGVTAYAQAKRGTETRYIKTAPAWLNGDEWEDYAAQPLKSSQEETRDFLESYIPGYGRMPS